MFCITFPTMPNLRFGALDNFIDCFCSASRHSGCLAAIQSSQLWTVEKYIKERRGVKGKKVPRLTALQWKESTELLGMTYVCCVNSLLSGPSSRLMYCERRRFVSAAVSKHERATHESVLTWSDSCERRYRKWKIRQRTSSPESKFFM